MILHKNFKLLAALALLSAPATFGMDPKTVLHDTLNNPELRDRFREIGAETQSLTPWQFGEKITNVIQEYVPGVACAIDACARDDCALFCNDNTQYQNCARAEFEEQILQTVAQDTEHKSSYTYTSLGSGYLAQDLRMLTRLIRRKKYNNVTLNLIDTVYKRRKRNAELETHLNNLAIAQAFLTSNMNRPTDSVLINTFTSLLEYSEQHGPRSNVFVCVDLSTRERALETVKSLALHYCTSGICGYLLENADSVAADPPNTYVTKDGKGLYAIIKLDGLTEKKQVIETQEQ